VSKFCRANDLPPTTLSLWRSQGQGSGSNTEDGGLVEISVAAVMGEPDHAPGEKVHLPNCVRLELVAVSQRGVGYPTEP
jgi:hypothetical protein